MYEEFDLTEEDDDCDLIGSISGYATDNMEQLNNFLNKHGYFDIDTTKYSGSIIGIIESLHVEEENRGFGVGTSLFESILDKFSDNLTRYIFLICDNAEQNVFNLQQWYEGHDFVAIPNGSEFPLMIIEC